jgi:DNA-binding LacI/PurR family transcriptional regulator
MDCARVIQLRIASGEWQQTLPGERRLADTLQVGRDTVRSALQHLEREGMIAPPASGARRCILTTSKGNNLQHPLKIGLLAHQRLEQMPQPMLLEIDRIRDALARKGGALEVFAPSWYDQRNPTKRLDDLVREEPCSVWILLRSSATVQAWFMKHRIPSLIRGYPHPGIGIPHLDVDWHATARHAASQLWRMGHRQVLVLSPPEPLKGVEAAVRGVLDLREPGFEAAVLVDDGTTAGMGKLLDRALRVKQPPTAIIASRPRQAATALTWLASRGIRVPQHLSLITLAWEPFLDHLVPSITGYHVDPECVAKLVVRRLERLAAGDPNPGGNVWITPEPVKGASVAKV